MPESEVERLVHIVDQISEERRKSMQRRAFEIMARIATDEETVFVEGFVEVVRRVRRHMGGWANKKTGEETTTNDAQHVLEQRNRSRNIKSALCVLSIWMGRPNFERKSHANVFKSLKMMLICKFTLKTLHIFNTPLFKLPQPPLDSAPPPSLCPASCFNETFCKFARRQVL